MLEWPATPSQGRLARAARVLNQNKRKRPQNPSERADIRLAADIAALAEYYDAQGYQEWATRTFIEECDRKEYGREECGHRPDDAAVLETMAAIAHRGDTEATMGLALASRRHAPSSRTVAYGFAKLHRSPDWMGFCLALPRVQGLTVLVTESLERSKTPGMVLALPPENVPRPVGARGVPRRRGQDPPAGPEMARRQKLLLDNPGAQNQREETAAGTRRDNRVEDPPRPHPSRKAEWTHENRIPVRSRPPRRQRQDDLPHPGRSGPTGTERPSP